MAMPGSFWPGDRPLGVWGGGRSGFDSMSQFPTVSSPEEALATTTREDYMSFLRDYSGFEQDLLGRLDDTTLVDAARSDAELSRGVSAGVRQRLSERYGQRLTPMQQRSRARSSGLMDTLGTVQSISDARLAQEDTNQALLSNLYNIGQGLSQGSMQTLQQTAATAASRRAAEAQRDAAKGPGGILGFVSKLI